MIQSLLNGIFNLIINLINLLLTPINNLIAQYLPSVDSALTNISYGFIFVKQFLSFICGWLLVPQWFLTTAVAVLTFKYTVPLLVSTIKLAVKWYHQLVP